MGDGHEERGGGFDDSEAPYIPTGSQDPKDLSGLGLGLTGRQGLEARGEVQGLIARDRGRERFPFPRIPSPEEVLGEICPVCKGTTWVVRANAELEGPIMAQLEHCDNPDCPQMQALGVRDILHLSVPYNQFDGVITVGQNERIAALIVKG